MNNYFRNGANQIEKNTFSTRVDHYFNESNRFFARFNYDNTPNNRATTYGDDNIATPTAGPQVFTRHNAVIEDTQIFSPTLLGVFRYSYTRLGNQRKPYSDGFDITTLGFPAGLSNAIGAPISFPAITVTGLSVSSSIANIIVGGVLGASDLIRLGCDTHAGMAQVTKTFSQHVVKTGLEFRLIRANMLQHGDSATNFSFANTWTQGPNPAQSSAGAGVGVATMLLGVAGGSVSPAPGWAQQQKYYAAFVQDDWRATSRLTVNLGVRYDFESPRTGPFQPVHQFRFRREAAAQRALARPARRAHVPGRRRDSADPDGPRPEQYRAAPRCGL